MEIWRRALGTGWVQEMMMGRRKGYLVNLEWFGRREASGECNIMGRG